MVAWELVREEVIKRDSPYHFSTTLFHQFQVENSMIGLRFAWEEDARTFAGVVHDVVSGQPTTKGEDGPSFPDKQHTSPITRVPQQQTNGMDGAKHRKEQIYIPSDTGAEGSQTSAPQSKLPALQPPRQAPPPPKQPPPCPKQPPLKGRKTRRRKHKNVRRNRKRGHEHSRRKRRDSRSRSQPFHLLLRHNSKAGRLGSSLGSPAGWC
ncbi:protein VASP homolog isoform X2 [Portunus trituberculatus]|uniref:protein VASP homolog isoform X2 n=1 Tax=Portunus trituberculatus TaxID=210409 RepID=UPI001E1CCF62|nr:protein VASP homolog isoform X2 [Portunus trituberculatus]